VPWAELDLDHVISAGQAMAEKGHGDGAKTMGNTMEYMAKYGIVWQDMAIYIYIPIFRVKSPMKIWLVL
jgi:hypothetical protein